jgi:hypothetical protein
MRPRGLRIDQHLQPLAVHQPDRTAGKRDVIGCRGRHDGDFGLRCRDGFRDYWKRTNPGEWLFPGREPGQPVSPLTIDRAESIERLDKGYAAGGFLAVRSAISEALQITHSMQ